MIERLALLDVDVRANERLADRGRADIGDEDFADDRLGLGLRQPEQEKRDE